ncbi:MAG: hypothetical protein RL385_4739, partial [Pseudomonadota bacterium]
MPTPSVRAALADVDLRRRRSRGPRWEERRVMLGWDTVEELHRGTRSALTRVRRPSDGTTFVFKQSLARTAEDAVQREERVLSVLLGCEGVIRSFGVA